MAEKLYAAPEFFFCVYIYTGEFIWFPKCWAASMNAEEPKMGKNVNQTVMKENWTL